MDLPFMYISPESNCKIPATDLSVVVFPAPL